MDILLLGINSVTDSSANTMQTQTAFKPGLPRTNTLPQWYTPRASVHHGPLAPLSLFRHRSGEGICQAGFREFHTCWLHDWRQLFGDLRDGYLILAQPIIAWVAEGSFKLNHATELWRCCHAIHLGAKVCWLENRQWQCSLVGQLILGKAMTKTTHSHNLSWRTLDHEVGHPLLSEAFPPPNIGITSIATLLWSTEDGCIQPFCRVVLSSGHVVFLHLTAQLGLSVAISTCLLLPQHLGLSRC